MQMKNRHLFQAVLSSNLHKHFIQSFAHLVAFELTKVSQQTYQNAHLQSPSQNLSLMIFITLL